MSHPAAPALPDPGYPAPPPQQKGNGLAVTALVLGIFTLVICLIPVVNNVAYFTGIAAIVLGFIGRRGNRAGKGMALAGIITAVIGIIGAIVSTILYVSVLNGVSNELNKAAKPISGASASSSSSTTTEPSDTETTPAEEDTTQGPVTLKIGDTASVTVNDSEGASMKVTKVTVSTRPFDTSFGEKPKNGAFKVVTVAAANSGSEAYDVNPFDWYFLGSDGTKYEYGDDNALMSGYDGKDFNGTTLNEGEKTSGTMVFDVPKKAVKLVYAPGFDSEPIAIWTTK